MKEFTSRLAAGSGRRYAAVAAPALALAFALAFAVAGLPQARAAGFAASPAAAAAPAAQAQDRGKALYEARCGGCHDRSVHQRSARAAADLAGVRAAVERWDRELGALWRGDEIDAVTRYLNERFYRFPCSGPGCPGPRAASDPGGR